MSRVNVFLSILFIFIICYFFPVKRPKNSTNCFLRCKKQMLEVELKQFNYFMNNKLTKKNKDLQDGEAKVKSK